MRKGYTTVKIPTKLARKLDAITKNLGYTSRAKKIEDAIRRFIEFREAIPKLETLAALVQSR